MHQRVEGSSGATLALLGDVSADLEGLLGEPEWWRLSSRELVAGVDAAYRLVTQAQTVALSLLGEFDSRRLGMEAGAASTQGWLTARRRVRPPAAKRDVQLARLVHAAETASASPAGPVEGAAVRDGLVHGGVSVDQAGVIACALGELPDDTEPSTRVSAERLLVAEAAVHGPVPLARLGHRIAEHVDPDAADRTLAAQLAREERAARATRSGTRYADGHGSVFYKFRVPVSDDVLIWPVLDALAAPQPAGAGDGIGGTDTRSPQQRLADGFTEAMRRVSLDGGLPSRGGDRPRTLLTMDFDDLKAATGAGTMVDTGDLLDPGAVRRHACDAQIIPQVLGGQSQILDQGRAARTAQGPLRTAVYTRDGGCVHPGCTRPPRWCNVHHVVAWWDGGPTSLANCVTLCGYHHRLYDDGAWGLRFAPDGTPETIPPTWIDINQTPRRHERFKERRAP